MTTAEADDDQPTADMPDWLEEVAPVAETEISDEDRCWRRDIVAETADLAEDGFDWSRSGDDEPTDEAQPVADMPDWLEEAAPVAETDDRAKKAPLAQIRR